MTFESVVAPDNWKKLLPHPLAMMFPPASDEILADIQASMELGGFNEDHPITLFEGLILDGLNRMRAWKAACANTKTNAAPGFRNLIGSLDDAIDYVVTANLHRRDLGKIVRVLIVRKIDDFRAAKRGNPVLAQIPQMGHVDPTPLVRKRVGELAHVSGMTVKRADNLIRAVGPERINRVIAGTLTVPAAMKEAASVNAGKTVPPMPPNVDAAGRFYVDRSKEAVTDGRRMVLGLAREVAALRRRIIEVTSKSIGRSIHAQTVEIDMGNVEKALKAAAPFTDCPINDACTETCTLCHGTGWITEGQFATVPARLRKTGRPDATP